VAAVAACGAGPRQCPRRAHCPCPRRARRPHGPPSKSPRNDDPCHPPCLPTARRGQQRRAGGASRAPNARARRCPVPAGCPAPVLPPNSPGMSPPALRLLFLPCGAPGGMPGGPAPARPAARRAPARGCRSRPAAILPTLNTLTPDRLTAGQPRPAAGLSPGSLSSQGRPGDPRAPLQRAAAGPAAAESGLIGPDCSPAFDWRLINH
jgi:hypothetical protein